MHLIRVPSVQPPATVWLDTLLRCEWGCYGIHTTSPCPPLDLWWCSELPPFGSAPCFVVSKRLPLASDLQIQNLSSST